MVCTEPSRLRPGAWRIPGTHSGFKGSAAHLAGEPIVLRLGEAEIIGVVVESRREHRRAKNIGKAGNQ